jgi:winged helix-turn helix protein
LGNGSQACEVMGDSRESCYRFTERYDGGGEAACQERSRRKPDFRNRVVPEVEEAVVALA